MNYSIGRSIGVPVGTGLAAATIGVAVDGFQNVNFLGYSISAPLAYGLFTGGASAVTEWSKNYIVPYITGNPAGSTALYIVQPAITGAALAGIAYIVSGYKDDNGLYNAFVVGAVSQLVGNYIGSSVDQVLNSIMPGATSSAILI